MKVSVSLPEEDVEFLDAYAEAQGPAYEDAWTEWADGDDQDLWENATSDGLG